MYQFSSLYTYFIETYGEDEIKFLKENKYFYQSRLHYQKMRLNDFQIDLTII